MTRRVDGFTLIELLVVIAIIGILAAMLFPVFARARESARKVQCLSNVKNVAMAVQMYLTDYDRFPPLEHRAEVRGWVEDYGGCCEQGIDCRATQANPYLRWPVVLDEYTKNRDIWRCPSARNAPSFGINPGYGTGDWFRFMVDTVDADGCRVIPCARTFPPGWGGDVTDSAAQGQCGGPGTGGIEYTIGAAGHFLQDKSTSIMEDPVKYVVCADAGSQAGTLEWTSFVAYPDVCRIDHVAGDPDCGADWANCPDTQECTAGKGVWQIGTDPEYRKSWARARHLGGSNLGFADGHAEWMPSEAILFDGIPRSPYGTGPTKIMNMDCCFCAEKQY